MGKAVAPRHEISAIEYLRRASELTPAKVENG